MSKRNGKRRSAGIKEELVLRLMRGEDLETVARKIWGHHTGFTEILGTPHRLPDEGHRAEG